MAYGLSPVQLPHSRMDFTKLPLLLLYISGYSLCGQKGLRALRTLGKRIQALLCR